MSIELVRSEIRKFLSTATPEVICIMGQWGVGKTFAWNQYLKQARCEQEIALKRYAYVSLFGINSLDELKYSVFENSIKVSEIGIEPSLDTLESNTAAAVERLGRKSLWFLQQLPIVKNYVGGLGPVWFLSVKETLVCIDDIERKGKGLDMRDVLGLISHLKEHKRCKVALILNDEAMEGAESAFRTYFEKVVDTSFKFAPSPQESIAIGLQLDSAANKMLAQSCVSLGISNIRLIKRLERLLCRIAPLLVGFEPVVLTQAVQSLALLGWTIFEPGRAPSMEFLRNRGSGDDLRLRTSERRANLTPEEARWNALLDAYHFGSLDEFDLALLDGIQRGYFDSEQITALGLTLDQKIKMQESQDSFFRAWELYHDSFDNNQDEVLDKIHQAFMRDVRYISPTNLNGTVTLFKELGRDALAAELVKYYMDHHGTDPRQFDLKRDPFGADVTDPDVRQAFDAKYAEIREQRKIAEILLTIATNSGWTQDDVSALASASVEEYYDVFKSSRGDKLRRVINACLQFGAYTSTPAMKEIFDRAKEALKRIGAESEINARRVERYGIK